MDLKLALHQPSLSSSDVQNLTRDICTAMQSEAHVHATLAQGEMVAGQKGDPVTLGAITLTVLTSGTAVAIFQVIRAYFERDKKLEITVERDDGRKITMNATNLHRKQFDELLAALH